MSPGRKLELVLLPLPLALLPLVLFGLSRGEDRFAYPEPPARSLQLVIATPHWKGIRVEMDEGFRRWLWDEHRLGVEVTWLDQGGGTTTLHWIQEQFRRSPDGIGVDLLFGGGTDPYETLKGDGLLARYEPAPEVLAGVALELHGVPILDPERRWFGNCLTGFGIMVNHAVARRVPGLEVAGIDAWEDLADRSLDGFVAAADPRRSSSYHTFYEILLQGHGFAEGLALARRIAANTGSWTQYSSEIPKIVATGQAACAPSMDQYAFAQINKVGDAIGFVLPGDGTLINADAVGILKGAPNREAAERFIDFLLSPAAGRLWMLRSGEPGGPRRYTLTRAAIRPALFAEVEGRSLVRDDPFRLPARLSYSYDKARVRWNALNDLLAALLVDTHAELRRAAAALDRLDGAEREAAERIFDSLPIDEERMQEIAANEWRDAGFRERMRIEWSEFARARYAEVLRRGEAAAAAREAGR